MIEGILRIFEQFAEGMQAACEPKTWDQCPECEDFYPTGSSHECAEPIDEEDDDDDVDVIFDKAGRAYRNYWQGPERIIE